jgi:hypothetical protein
MQNTTNQLFRLINEMVFMLVGALLLWVGLFAGYLRLDPRQPAWLIVTAVLILWGARTWSRAPRYAIPKERLAMRIGGGSMALAGFLLLFLAWAPFRWAGMLLAATGGIFVLRGLVTAGIMARPS